MTSLPTASLLMVTYSLLAMAAVAADDDQVCLTHLYQSLQDPLNHLTNWTPSTFASPCTGFTSHLYGATCNNGRVYKLSLSNLSLRGTIPPNLSLCTSLQSLDLSSNRLSGPIPPELHSLLNLALLNLSSNLLSGPIPPDLALCAYLNFIDLHSNLLTGTIPPQLGLLSRLSFFDVSYNRLEGEIPSSLGNRSGLAVRFNASSFVGNKGLYGYPLGEGRGGGGGHGGAFGDGDRGDRAWERAGEPDHKLRRGLYLAEGDGAEDGDGGR
ncbi:hypothetical protein MLD38_005044 [Melastoma candidum]|uniref:Uncharacterized protein n=1 Tax=Melastoma candidum TaxID=119954 RepID=A0ACB9S753_9MYRT|nr:hypothetical protein MLD38_005044 [Melastoma candidum]